MGAVSEINMNAAAASYYVYVIAAAVFFFLAMTAAAFSKTSNQGAEEMTTTDKIKTFAGAIAFAEGYWNRAGIVFTENRPARNNNPGDFIGDGDDGNDNGYAKYSTIEKGWQRLYNQLNLIVNGPHTLGRISGVPLDGTISDLAYVWTATQQDEWSENVASYLGVTRDTPLRGLLT